MANGQIDIDVNLNKDQLQASMGGLRGELVKGMAVFEVLKQGVQKVAGMIIGSIDAAMKRIDTMDQFSRVMTTMTGSADKASAALSKTNDIVTGTAFGLDTAAKGVQAFVASGMEVSKATDTMSAWGDAVAFYTKGTNADLETVSMALQKMGTKGNVTMEHLQMLLEAGIPAIQIYASAVGISTEEVTDQMSKGELKTSDFINVMNAAFQTGTAGFPAIAGAAKNAGSSWQGSIDNMKAAVARGTASMLTSFDNLFNVKSGIVSFGKGIETVLKGLANNLHIIIPLIGIATGAFVAYKAALGIQSIIEKLAKAKAALTVAMSGNILGITTEAAATMGLTSAQALEATAVALVANGHIAEAVALKGATFSTALHAAATGVLTGQIGLATAAQYIWNAAMTANPIGLVIALVAGLTAGLYALSKALESDAYKEQKEKVDALKDAHDELKNSMGESAAAYEDQKREIYATGVAAQQAIDKLSQFGDGTLSAAADQAVMESALQRLNDTYENLNVTQEEFEKDPEGTIKRIQAYKDLTQSIAEYDAYLNRVAAVEDENAQAQAGLLQVEIQRKEIAQQIKDGTLSWYEAGKLAQDLYWIEKDYNDTLEETKGQMEALASISEDSEYRREVAAKNRLDAENGATDAEGRNLKKLAQEWGLTEEKILASMETTGKSLAEWSEDNKKYYTKDGKNLAQVAKQYGKTEDEVKKHLDEMGINLDAYIEYQNGLLTESGYDINDIAKKWGVTVGEIEAYMKEMGGNLDDYNKHMQDTHTDAGLSLEQLALKWGTTTEAIQEAMLMQDMSMQEWSDQQDENLADVKESYSGYFDTVTNGFDKMEQESAISLDKFMKNMEANNEATANWSANMQTLMAAGVDQGVIAQLAKLGPEGAKQAQVWVQELTKLNDGTDISLGNLNERAQNKLSELAGVMSQGVQTAADATKTEQLIGEYTASGEAYADSIATGIMNSNAPTEAAKQSAANATNAAGTVYNSADNSKAGSESQTQVARGIESNKAPEQAARAKAQEVTRIFKTEFEGVGFTTILTNAITAMAERVKVNLALTLAVANRMQDARTAAEREASSGWSDIGSNMIQGMASGVRNNQSILTSAIEDVVNAAIQKAKDVAVIKSPSRVFADQVGYMFPAGIAVGVKEGAPLALDSVEKMTQSLIKAGSTKVPVSVGVGKYGGHGMTSGVVNNFEQNNTIVNPPQTPGKMYRELRRKGRQLIHGI